MEKVEAEFVENFLIIWNPKLGSKIYQLGFYGKPLGIPKPKKKDFEMPLILDLMEGLHLFKEGYITVFEGVAKEKVELKTLYERAKKMYDEFDLKYEVYRNLRNQELIVSPGVKYGCDFVVYNEGPGLDHAPFLVSVRSKEEEITATEIVKAGRLATTVRKRFIIAIPDLDENNVEYFIFRWFKA